MSSMNDGNDLLSASAGKLGSAQWLLKQFYVLFAKLWIPVQLTIAAFGLVIAIYYGVALRQSLLNAHRSVATVFASKVEPTRSAEQGILAFLLSGVNDEWARVDKLNTAELNSILQDINLKVQQETAKASQAASVSAGPIIDKLNLKTSYSGSLSRGETWQTAIVSQQRKESYVAVPAITLRRRSLNEPPLNPNDRSRLIAALEHNPEILFDLNLAAELEPLMQELDKASGEKLTVIQTYFITESGVFLIRASGVNDQSNYYSNQFRPYTQHIDRPYFWGAVDAVNPIKPTPFDYGTKPYLDLGGNGFVVTFSKKFDLPNHRVGVLCVDAKLPDEVTVEIKTHLQDLGAKVSDFYWKVGTGVEPGNSGQLPQQFSWFDSQLRKISAKSDVMGRITTEPIGPSQHSVGKGGQVVRFTVPVWSGEYESGVKETKFLLVEFDPDGILRMLTKNLALFTGGIIVVIAVTFSLFWDYTRLKREMSNVLEKMANVMRNASTPFVWLDEKNEFIKVNKSMLTVLGYKNLDELKRHSPTFRGLLTDDSQDIYEGILDTSSAGGETGEYEISIITKSGTVLNVRAHGERIPYPTWWRRGLPHRFGIFVEVTQSTNSPQAEPAMV